MIAVQKTKIDEVLDLFDCSSAKIEYSFKNQIGCHEILKGDGVLRIINNEYECCAVVEISHGPSDGEVAGYIELGRLDAENLDEFFFLDSIEHGMELLNIEKRA